MINVGIDLGGTKTEIIVLQDGKERHRHRVATPATDYLEILKTITGLVKSAIDDFGSVSKVGIGMPGAEDDDGLIKNANTQCLIKKPLRRDLEQLLSCSVVLMNDANCFTLSEAVDGAASNFASVFGLILGTGVGGGLVIDKKIVRGRNFIAGEWGHNPMPDFSYGYQRLHNRDCYCGRKNCIETFLSGGGFFKTLSTLNADFNSLEALNNAAIEGSVDADELINIYAEQLAAALSVVVNILDPDCVVLGGGLSNFHQLAERVEDALPKYIFSNSCHTRVVPNLHGDSSGVRGAAWL